MRARYIKPLNQLFENLEDHPAMPIEEFVNVINLPKQKQTQAIDWWKKNRGNIKIHFVEFSTHEPILGVFMSGEDVLVNAKAWPPAPPELRLFIAAHESRHADQHRKGMFGPNYFDPVVNDDFEKFKHGYQRLEKDANDFAFNAMEGMGVRLPIPEQHIRGNERAAHEVFYMMQRDIKESGATDMFELLKSQIF